jgi:hypothetical protein
VLDLLDILYFSIETDNPGLVDGIGLANSATWVIKIIILQGVYFEISSLSVLDLAILCFLMEIGEFGLVGITVLVNSDAQWKT